MQFTTANDLLKETLAELAKNTVSRELGTIIREIDKVNAYEEEALSDLIQSYHKIEKSSS
ncbi:hypothetical protein HZS_693 [Henneguya salminicola]|nr:hypothetical protein HZS_693 [Henneguya salminicola]